MPKLMTLCLVQQDNRLLLGFKKRGFGQGRWNGFGGKPHDGESIEEAAKREMEEEVGIIPADIKKRGVLTFEFADQPKMILEVHIFSATKFSGQPIETDEMKPQWFAIDQIPYSEMWPDDTYWLPLFLAGKNFKGSFYFRDYDTLLSHQVEEILDF